MDNTFSAGNRSTTASAGEFPEVLPLALLAAGGAGIPCACYGEPAVLRARGSAEDLAAFFKNA